MSVHGSETEHASNAGQPMDGAPPCDTHDTDASNRRSNQKQDDHRTTNTRGDTECRKKELKAPDAMM